MITDQRRLPTLEQRRQLTALWLVERDDGDSSYVRYNHVAGNYGIVYAAGAVLPWAFYCKHPCPPGEMVWAATLDAIVDLIVWAAEQ